MDKIRKYSKFLKILFEVVLGIVIILPIIMWALYPIPSALSNTLMLLGLKPTIIPDHLQILYPMTWNLKFIGLTIYMMPVAALAFVILKLSQLFSAFEKNRIFEINNVQIIRSIGIGIIFNQLLCPVREALLTLVLSLPNPPGYGFVNITFTATNLGIVILGVITLVISAIFLEAVKLREENLKFV